MSTKGLSHTVNKILSVLFGVIVVFFSSYNTWSLLNHTSGNPLLATLGLILFEGGLLYWWFTFQHGAHGLPQMAISLLVFILCMVAVALANAIELGAYRIEVGSVLPNQLIAIATLIHLVAKMVYPLVSPETAQAIKTRVLEGKLIDKASVMLDSKIDNLADEIANRMSDNARDTVLLSFGHTHAPHALQAPQPTIHALQDETVGETAETVETVETLGVAKMRQVTCKTCGNVFTSTSGNAKYCSDKCRLVAYRSK